jgi:hypothetical protein
MLFYYMPYIILGYFNYSNLYTMLLEVIIGYYKLLYLKILYVIIF